MGTVTRIAASHHSVTLFGATLPIALAKDRQTECDCAALRAENERLQALWSQEVKGQLAIAEKLAELMEREPALLAAIERAEAAQRYSEQSLQIAQSHIADLQAEIEFYRKGASS